MLRKALSMHGNGLWAQTNDFMLIHCRILFRLLRELLAKLEKMVTEGRLA